MNLIPGTYGVTFLHNLGSSLKKWSWNYKYIKTLLKKSSFWNGSEVRGSSSKSIFTLCHLPKPEIRRERDDPSGPQDAEQEQWADVARQPASVLPEVAFLTANVSQAHIYCPWGAHSLVSRWGTMSTFRTLLATISGLNIQNLLSIYSDLEDRNCISFILVALISSKLLKTWKVLN